MEKTTTVDVRIADLVDPEQPDGKRASIIFYGPQDPQVIHLFSPRDILVVGRLYPADVCIYDPSLSRQHARFYWGDGHLKVDDLQSRNGVWLGNKRIESAILYSGAELKLGAVRAMVAIAEDTPSAPAPSAVTVRGAENLVVLNPAMRAVYDQVAQVASSDASVLILGETGTGKEHVAQALHGMGSRSDKPFKVINCGAVPRELTESMLFGHEKGAFTGAVGRNIGLFEQADKGVLFLDEIGELAPLAQAALLRAVETKKITRLGSNREIEVDVRIIAATHCDVEAMVKEGSFRRDLLYRINIVTLELPPLRERRDEIIPLSELFLARACESWKRKPLRIDTRAAQKLQAYDWPGNIRQLRNVIERCVLLCRSELITVNDLPAFIVEPAYSRDVPAMPAAPAANDSDLSYNEQLRDWEIALITRAMSRTAGNQRAAARLLRIPRRTLAYKLKTYNLDEMAWAAERGPEPLLS